MGTSVFSRRALLTAASAASGSWVLSACGSQEPQTSGNTSATASTTPSATGTTSPASASSSPTATPKVTKSSTPSNPTIKPSPRRQTRKPQRRNRLKKLTQRPRPQSLHIPKTRSRNQKAALQKNLPRPRAKNLLSTHRSSRTRNRYGASSIKLAHSHRKIGPRRIWCRFMGSSYVLRRLRRHSP